MEGRLLGRAHPGKRAQSEAEVAGARVGEVTTGQVIHKARDRFDPPLAERVA
jgi:hypothetical protein